MAAGNVAVSQGADVAGNVQQVEASSLLPHDTALADAAEVRTIAEAEERGNGRQAQAASRVTEPKSTRGRELVAGAVRTLSSICGMWARL